MDYPAGVNGVERVLLCDLLQVYTITVTSFGHALVEVWLTDIIQYMPSVGDLASINLTVHHPVPARVNRRYSCKAIFPVHTLTWS